jgi:hypothetical protein
MTSSRGLCRVKGAGTAVGQLVRIQLWGQTEARLTVVRGVSLDV